MKQFSYIGAFVFAWLLLAETVYAGFGITPPYVRNDRLTQGSEYTQEIILVRGDPVDDLNAEITINVPGISDWFTVDRGLTFLLPKGESQVPIRITVSVPNDAPYDTYSGSIRVRTIPTDPASGVSIALGAQIDVDLEVVDQILDFDVKRVQLREVEEPRRRWWLEFPGKIRFSMTLNNTGNAAVAPDRVRFEIYDKRGTVLLETVEHTNRIESVAPFETKAVEAHLPTRLPPGAYLVRYNIYLRDSLKRSGELTLSVLPEGTLENYQGYGFMGLSLGDKLSLIIPPIVLLLALFAAVVVARLLKRRPPPRPPAGPPTTGSPPYTPDMRSGVRRTTQTFGHHASPPQRRLRPQSARPSANSGDRSGGDVVNLSARRRG